MNIICLDQYGDEIPKETTTRPCKKGFFRNKEETVGIPLTKKGLREQGGKFVVFGEKEQLVLVIAVADSDGEVPRHDHLLPQYRGVFPLIGGGLIYPDNPPYLLWGSTYMEERFDRRSFLVDNNEAERILKTIQDFLTD